LGAGVAFLAETVIAFLMMTLVLALMSRPSLSRFTGLAAGLFVAICIIVEAPLSGMSMNPARSLGSNLLSHAGKSLWIYFTAPVLGMCLAAEVYARWPESMRSLSHVHHSR
jgi:aquaporin Z